MLVAILERGRGNGKVVEGVVLGTGAVLVAGVAGGSIPACLNIFISARGSAGAGAGAGF